MICRNIYIFCSVRILVVENNLSNHIRILMIRGRAHHLLNIKLVWHWLKKCWEVDYTLDHQSIYLTLRKHHWGHLKNVLDPHIPWFSVFLGSGSEFQKKQNSQNMMFLSTKLLILAWFTCTRGVYQNNVVAPHPFNSYGRWPQIGFVNGRRPQISMYRLYIIWTGP